VDFESENRSELFLVFISGVDKGMYAYKEICHHHHHQLFITYKAAST